MSQIRSLTCTKLLDKTAMICETIAIAEAWADETWLLARWGTHRNEAWCLKAHLRAVKIIIYHNLALDSLPAFAKQWLPRKEILIISKWSSEFAHLWRGRCLQRASEMMMGSQSSSRQSQRSHTTRAFWPSSSTLDTNATRKVDSGTSNAIHITRLVISSTLIESTVMTPLSSRCISRQLNRQSSQFYLATTLRYLHMDKQALVKPSQWRASSMGKVRNSAVSFQDQWRKSFPI